jgi:hypothetical protein
LAQWLQVKFIKDIGIKGLPPGKFFRVYANLDKELTNKVDIIDFDILANHKSRFEWRSTQSTIERTIAEKGMVLYERL